MLTMIVVALVICEMTEDIGHHVAKMLHLLGLGADQSQRLVRQCCGATVKSAIARCIASMPSRTLRTPWKDVGGGSKSGVVGRRQQ